MSLLWTLRGGVGAKKHGELVTRLRGLCDGLPATQTGIEYHEQVWLASKATKNGGAVTFRVRHHLGSGRRELIYLGPIDTTALRADRMAAQGRGLLQPLSQTYTSAEAGANLSDFVKAMGFQLEYELCRKGMQFSYRTALNITLTQVMKLTTAEDPASATAVNESFVLEVQAIGNSSASSKDAICKEMCTFAEQLKPLVSLEAPSR